MHRQLSDKDCAVTALAHALGISYRTVVNSFPIFRYMNARRRIRREKEDQIIGRRKKLRPLNGKVNFDKQVRRSDREYNRHRYNRQYRSDRFPYFTGFGLADREYKELLDELDILYVQRENCTLEMLRHVKFALLSVPSINVKNSAHMIIWKDGRIWDPSPKKRYDYSKLRKAAGITCLAIAADTVDYHRLRKVLRTKLHGGELISLLTYHIMVEMQKDENHVVDPSKITTWWKSGQIVPPEVENRLIMDRSPAMC